jgi:hypothetical protein
VPTTTTLVSPGVYEGGDYRLGQHIRHSGDVFSFNGNATLDLSGWEIEDTSEGNDWTCCIQCVGTLQLFDSTGRGAVIGGRVGVKVWGADSRIAGINFRRQRYIGALMHGHRSRIADCAVIEVGGVSDELYAIGVQFSDAEDCSVIRLAGRDIYRQVNGPREKNGEGVLIAFQSDSRGGRVIDCSLRNSILRKGTMGVFLGQGGGHSISGLYTHNVLFPFGSVAEWASVENVVATYGASAAGALRRGAAALFARSMRPWLWRSKP